MRITLRFLIRNWNLLSQDWYFLIILSQQLFNITFVYVINLSMHWMNNEVYKAIEIHAVKVNHSALVPSCPRFHNIVSSGAVGTWGLPGWRAYSESCFFRRNHVQRGISSAVFNGMFKTKTWKCGRMWWNLPWSLLSWQDNSTLHTSYTRSTICQGNWKTICSFHCTTGKASLYNIKILCFLVYGLTPCVGM